jgi:hypothetical protein
LRSHKPGDLVQSFSGSLKHPLRSFNTYLQNLPSRRNSQLSREHALEVAHPHRHAVGKNGERELLVNISAIQT